MTLQNQGPTPADLESHRSRARKHDPQENNTNSSPDSQEIRVSLFRKGIHNVASNEQVESWDEFVDLLTTPEIGPKNGAYFVRGFCDGPREDANMAGLDLIIIDGDQMIGSSRDSCCPAEPVADVLKNADITHAIFSTHSADPDNNIHKWRAVIPCPGMISKAALEQAVAEVITLLHDQGLMVRNVKENNTLSQGWFLPRCRDELAKQNFFYGYHDGQPWQITGHAEPSARVKNDEAAPTTTGKSGFSWDQVLEQFESGTIHQGIMTACGWFVRTTDWSDGQIKDHILAEVKRLCPNNTKVQRAITTQEIDNAIRHCRQKNPITGPVPLPDELSPVAEFDFDLLPDSLRAWAQDICDRVQCPPDFVGAGVIASLAAVLGRKVGIRPQAKTDWTVTPNMWAMVVGRPGVLKSPALEAVLAPLKRLVAQANEDYASSSAEYQKAATVAKLRAEAVEKAARKKLDKDPNTDLSALFAVDEVAVPTLKRYVANDSTPASLGELLRQNPNGLLVYRDELVSLLKGLDREDQAEGRGFYLTGWNGDSPYTFDRIGRGLNLHIEAVCLSILGGTQPGRLAEYIRHAVKGGAADDGLIQRFGLLVWPDTKRHWKNVDRWPDTSAKNRAFLVYDALDKLDPVAIGAEQDTDGGIPYLRFDAAALELFLEWRTDLETRLRGGDLHPALESHFAKYRKLVPALALTIHLADGGRGPVTERATLQALAWGDYLETHARRAYGATAQPGVATAKAILHRIKKGDLPTTFSSWQVWRPGWAMLSDREQVAEALRLLVDYGHLREEKAETGGRPATTYILVEEGSR